MNRRGFLQSILAAGVAPAVIGSGILMPVRTIWKPKDILGTRYFIPLDLGGVTVLNEHWLVDAIRSGETVYWQDVTMSFEEYMQRGSGTYRSAITAKQPFAKA